MSGEKFKDIEINGRKFRISKFGARDGSYMLIKVTGFLAPMFAKIDFSKMKNVKKPEDVDISAIDIPGVIAGLGSLSEEDFSYIQEKCLKVCSEPLQAGFIPVLNDNGSFGVSNLEDDTITVISLTAHALIFNFTSFFEGSVLSGLMTGLLTTRQ